MHEVHIASFIGRTSPQDLPAAVASVEAFAGCEVHAQEESGKFIITIEANSHGEIAKQFDQLKALGSLADVQPVYHEYFEEPAV